MVQVAIELRHVHELFGGRLAPVIEFVKRADQKGIDQVVIADHVVVHDDAPPRYPLAAFPPLDYPWYDPVSILSGIATVTNRIRLSMGILISPLRPAALLAKQLATLDVLSGGRLDAGFGAGWQREEFEACGIPFEDRFIRMEEQAQACRALWQGGPAAFHGKTVSFAGLHCHPRPAQPTIPIWLGVTPSLISFARMVRCADGWIRPDPDPTRLAADIATLRGLLAKAGRDPGQFIVRAQVTHVLDGAGKPDIPASLARSRAYLEAGADILEYYPGRLCSSADQLEPLLDAIMEMKRSLSGRTGTGGA
jgi:probable F420-dependent oxidoreductase